MFSLKRLSFLTVREINALRANAFTSRENARSGLMTPEIRSTTFAEDVDELGLLTRWFL